MCLAWCPSCVRNAKPAVACDATETCRLGRPRLRSVATLLHSCGPSRSALIDCSQNLDQLRSLHVTIATALSVGRNARSAARYIANQASVTQNQHRQFLKLGIACWKTSCVKGEKRHTDRDHVRTASCAVNHKLAYSEWAEATVRNPLQPGPVKRRKRPSVGVQVQEVDQVCLAQQACTRESWPKVLACTFRKPAEAECSSTECSGM